MAPKNQTGLEPVLPKEVRRPTVERNPHIFIHGLMCFITGFEPAFPRVQSEGFEPPLYYSPPPCKGGALDQAELTLRDVDDRQT